MMDAWKQHHELVEKYTQEWTPRRDLVITAHACGRNVEFRLGEFRRDLPNAFDRPGKASGRWNWHSTGPRNVDTMRELAQALLDACDFVDASNPKWASNRLEGPIEIIKIPDGS